MTVGEVVALAASAWGKGARVATTAFRLPGNQDAYAGFPPHPARNLAMPSRGTCRKSSARTMEWYRKALGGADAWALARHQIDDYLAATAVRTSRLKTRSAWPRPSSSTGCPRAASVARSSRMSLLRRHAAGQRSRDRRRCGRRAGTISVNLGVLSAMRPGTIARNRRSGAAVSRLRVFVFEFGQLRRPCRRAHQATCRGSVVLVRQASPSRSPATTVTCCSTMSGRRARSGHRACKKHCRHRPRSRHRHNG